jgi:diaminopimelate decarboxylase
MTSTQEAVVPRHTPVRDSDAAVRTDGGAAVRRLADWDAGRLDTLAAEFDSPCYVLDPARVRENCRRMQAAFPDAHCQYAAKANTARTVLQTVHDEGFAVECASAGEVLRALAAGVPGADVTYTAVNPSAVDLDAVVEAWHENPGLTITAGAADTVDRLRERGYDGRLCIRVNPGVGAGHHEKVVTGGHPKFGVPYGEAARLAVDAADDFDLVGIHAHAGSGISGDDLEDHRELVARMGALARDVSDRGIDLEYVDVGGGFGVPYHEDEPPLDLDSVADATREALGEVDARLAIEPGRYLVADAGVLLTRVNTVKETAAGVVAGVDAGMTTLLRPAMYDAYHAVRNLDAESEGAASASGDGRETVGVTVAGPVCETADLLWENRPLPRPERGDLLVVGNAGAYGYEMSSTYNSRPRPPEVTLEGEVLRRRETLAEVSGLELSGEERTEVDR